MSIHHHNLQDELNDHRTRPGDPERDHTIPPSELDPNESPLPEGAQPNQRTVRLSLLVFVIATSTALIAVLASAFAVAAWESVALGAAVGIVLLAIGALPVSIAYHLRVRDLEELNRQERSKR